MKKNYVLLFFLLLTISTSAQDAGVLGITSPTINTNCGNTSDTFTVSFNIVYSENSGTIPCYYQLNNNAVVQQDYPWIGITSLNFPQQITPVNGLNTLRVWTALPGDTDPSNDEVTIQFEYTVNNPSLPYFENAESYPETALPQGNLGCLAFYTIGVDGQPNNFASLGVIDLTAYANTPAATSGTKAFSPSYLSRSFSSVYLETPDIDISSVSLAELSFDYHVYGRSQAPISVDIYHNGAWVEDVYTMTEEERQLEIYDPWKKKTILLDGYSGLIKIRFKYIDVDWLFWYDGDYLSPRFTGIDTIEVREAPSCPTPTNITVPFDQITKEVANITWDAGYIETDWEVEYGPVGFTPGTGTTAQTSQASYSIAGLTAGTEYDVYVKAVCGTTPGMNDSAAISARFETVCSLVAPWTEDVESQPSTKRGIIENCWKTDAYDTHSFRWDIINHGGGTPSSNTGPSLAYEGTHYFHIEGSIIEGGASFSIAPGVSTIYSPFIDVSGLANPALKFYYHMFGADVGSLSVDVFHNGSWTNDVHVISGQQQTADSDPWGSTVVDLAAFSGEIRLRFKGMSSFPSPYYSDIALDLIQVNELQVLSTPEVASDLGITLFPNPVADMVTITATEKMDVITIFSLEGRVVLAYNAEATDDAEFSVAQLETGVYFVEIKSNQKKQVIKMLKK